jgi:uncharacterized membrane protein YfcA
MSIDTVWPVVLALLAAGIVKGVTGIGYSTTALPLLALTVGLKTGMPLVLLPSISSNLLVMRDAGGVRDAIDRYWLVYLAVLPGLGLGLAVLPRTDEVVAAAVLGMVLATYAGSTLAGGVRSLPRRLESAARLPVGFATGFINGLTGSQVMPLVPYLLSLDLPPSLFVQACNISFTMSSLVMLAGLAWVGLLGWAELALSLAGIVPALLGVAIGTAIRRRLDARSLRNLVLVVLLVTGLALVLRALG